MCFLYVPAPPGHSLPHPASWASQCSIEAELLTERSALNAWAGSDAWPHLDERDRSISHQGNPDCGWRLCSIVWSPGRGSGGRHGMEWARFDRGSRRRLAVHHKRRCCVLIREWSSLTPGGINGNKHRTTRAQRRGNERRGLLLQGKYVKYGASDQTS